MPAIEDFTVNTTTVGAIELETEITPYPERLWPSNAWRTTDVSGDPDDFDPPAVDIGDIVLYVVNEHAQTIIGNLRGEKNSVTVGQRLPAMVLRRWGPTMLNLRLFVDGQQDAWLTSVTYSRPTALGNSTTPDLVVRPGTWHGIDEPTDWTMVPAPEDSSGLELDFYRRRFAENRVLATLAACEDRDKLNGTMSVVRLGGHPEDGWRVTYYDSAEKTTTEAEFYPESDWHKLVSIHHADFLEKCGILVE